MKRRIDKVWEARLHVRGVAPLLEADRRTRSSARKVTASSSLQDKLRYLVETSRAGATDYSVLTRRDVEHIARQRPDRTLRSALFPDEFNFRHPDAKRFVSHLLASEKYRLKRAGAWAQWLNAYFDRQNTPYQESGLSSWVRDQHDDDFVSNDNWGDYVQLFLSVSPPEWGEFTQGYQAPYLSYEGILSLATSQSAVAETNSSGATYVSLFPSESEAQAYFDERAAPYYEADEEEEDYEEGTEAPVHAAEVLAESDRRISEVARLFSRSKTAKNAYGLVVEFRRSPTPEFQELATEALVLYATDVLTMLEDLYPRLFQINAFAGRGGFQNHIPHSNDGALYLSILLGHARRRARDGEIPEAVVKSIEELRDFYRRSEPFFESGSSEGTLQEVLTPLMIAQAAGAGILMGAVLSWIEGKLSRHFGKAPLARQQPSAIDSISFTDEEYAKLYSLTLNAAISDPGDKDKVVDATADTLYQIWKSTPRAKAAVRKAMSRGRGAYLVREVETLGPNGPEVNYVVAFKKGAPIPPKQRSMLRQSARSRR